MKSKRKATSEKGEGRRDDSRPTNAWRYMVALSTRPYRTWMIVHEMINPYMLQLEQKRPQSAFFYQSELTEIMTTFDDIEEFKNNQALEGSYLLGFYCQRKALWKGKENNESEKSEGEQNKNDEGKDNE